MNSKEYWQEREEEALRHYVTDEQEYQRRLTRIYSNMLDGVQNEINAFYGRYASKEGITIAEARRRVSQADIAAYERKAERYVAERDFSPQANEEMRLYNLMMKVNRLEMLKANIGLELIAGHDELETFMEEILRGRTEEELARQAGILGKTVLNNAKRAEAIVNASFQNATFSDRIWMYQDMLRADLSTLLQSGLIQGKNPRELAKKLEQRFNVSASNAERLMRTELARVQTEAQKQSFKRNGFDMYEFICNHHPTKHGTCDICKGLNGKHFKVEDMMPGENAPPMHPNCRCSTAAWEDSEEYDAWLDYLANGGTTEEWNATGKKVWKKQRQVLAKSMAASTIKTGAQSGALTSKNDPDFERREAFADLYYQEVRGRKREYEIAAVAKHSGFNESNVEKVFAHVFELEHLFADGTIHRFDTDYDMAQSWIRLRDGRNIQEHDMILLHHELMEAEIMGTGTTVPYETAHNEVVKIYDYKTALLKYLRENDLE